MGPEIGVPKAAEIYLRAAIGRFLPPIEHAREALGYFPNSFSTLDFSHWAAQQTALL